MAKFIKACRCPKCDELCKDDGITIDFESEEGVVDFGVFGDSMWHCNNCGIDFGTPCDMGDFLEEF